MRLYIRRISRPLVCVLTLTLLLVVLHNAHESNVDIPQPLEGTYQYFRDVNFQSTTKRFGATSHHDARFAPTSKPEISEVHGTLTALLKSFLSFARELDIDVWLAHGTLLGWYWNQ